MRKKNILNMSAKVDKSEMFSGKKDGISFEKLDEMVLSWGRAKFGDKYATLLWKNELTDLNKLDLADELDAFEYDMHCTMVYDVLCYDSAKYADGLFETQRFWTVQYQLQARQRFRERMYCYLETIVKGEAARQIKKQGVRKMATMRDFLFRRFGAGQPEILEERVRKYLLGMPDPKTGEAFPPRCDMEEKLDQLEAEREYLVEMCPKDQRESYEDGKESTLVRIILRHRPKEYDSAVKTVMDLHRFRLYAKEGDLSKITNLEDNSRVIYNTDWLPNYDELRAALIAEYLLQKRRREENNQSTKKTPGHPVLPVLQGFEQPGSHQKTCYGCGEKGHFKGDAECKAEPNEVWSGAPESFKSKVKNGGKGKGKKAQGKGKGQRTSNSGDRQRNKKGSTEASKIPCKYYSSGNGYCKWGDNCRHSHAGKQGGKRKNSSTLILSRKDKKAKKEIVTMVVNDLKSSLGQKGKRKAKEVSSADNEEGDDELYDLVRGKSSTMMIQRLDAEDNDYLPKRRVIMMVSSEESDDSDYKPKKKPEDDKREEKISNTGKRETKNTGDRKVFESSSVEPAVTAPSSAQETIESGLAPFEQQATRWVEDKERHVTYISRYQAHLEKMDKEQKEQDARFQQVWEEQQQRIKDCERQWEERQRFVAEQRKALEEARKEEDRISNLIAATRKKSQRSATQEDCQVLELEHQINELEQRRTERWKELITSNKWDDHENDEEVISLRKALMLKQKEKIELQTKLELERKGSIHYRTERNSQHISPPTEQEWGSSQGSLEPDPNFAPTPWKPFQWGNNPGPQGPEEEPVAWGRSRLRRSPSSSSSSSRSSGQPEPEESEQDEKERERISKDNDEQESVRDEELDYLMVIKVKKGEKQAYVEFVMEEDRKGIEGPFGLGSEIIHLMAHCDRINKEKGEKAKNEEETNESSSSPSTAPYPGLSRGNRIPNVGLKELFESERANKKRKALNDEKTKERGMAANDPQYQLCSLCHQDLLSTRIAPRFTIGKRVYYFIEEPGNEKWHSARVMGITYPEEDGHPSGIPQIVYRILPDADLGQIYEQTTRSEHDLRDWTWTRPCLVGIMNKKNDPLLPLDRVGIDTCSALSVSSKRDDFLWLDESTEAKKSVILRGVGGDTAKIGGRGPMVVETIDDEGNRIVMFDHSAVFLKEAVNQAGFRIFGQQRMKRFGFNLQQRHDLEGGDILNYNNGLKKIPLQTNGGILTLKTVPRSLTAEQIKALENEIESAINGEEQNNYCLQVETHSSLLMNEAYLTKEEADRLQHWRIAHRVIDKSTLNEDCPVCVEGKKKVGTFKRNYEFFGHTKGPILPYFRLYCDGYGGQQSMGDLSYQGGKGGFVFACPSGSIKLKLYGSTDQFPSCLFQVLQEVESEGYVTREVYVDTHSVNLSRAVEEVAAMFRVRIIPVSAGTPQEMAYAESAVRTIGQMGRTLMCGAPHLPNFCWGLADLYAKEIHDILPQKKIRCSPYEFRTGRKPDFERAFIKVFGAPCQYSPMDGMDHKRAPKTEWGWFVGVQSPMCLVLRPEDEKILSVSKKKILVHEECYAKFNHQNGTNPLVHFAIPVIDIDQVKTQTENLKKIEDYKKACQIPDHVLSVKCLSDFTKHPELNVHTDASHPPSIMFQENQHEPQGEETKRHIPEHASLDKDLLLDRIKVMREMINKKFDKTGRVEAIVKALKRVEEETLNEAPRKGTLQSKKTKTNKSISTDNILQQKRRKREGISESGGVLEKNGTTRRKKEEPINRNKRNKKGRIEINDRVKIRTSKFGIGYAKGRPEFTYGRVLKINGKLYDVLWEVEEEDAMMTAHVRHLIFQSNLGEVKENEEEPKLFSKMTKETILPILSVGEALSQSNDDQKESWPKDFYEALLRDDWRDWVQAVKNENDSWAMFEASSEIPYEQMEKGASIIPLGELYSIKRSGKHKFRQYALGNLLKEGKDFGETFSSTVSGDGLRWFCSLACSCRKVIKGWDATTGYLQTQQRVKVYAYLPSHSGYSELSFEALAPFRMQLKRMEKEGGMKSVKDFARKMKKERRERPKTVLQLNKSVYGIPDAGQSFSMFMQGLHIKHCSMVQSEMDPCVYYRIMEDDKRNVKGYLLVISWVDDCRYFGTEDLIKEYEESVTKHCKCTLEGESTEFVSIQINHRIDQGFLELTQEEYWEKAVERFKEFLPKEGPKDRKIPLSPADEKLLVEPTEQEMKEAEHLPYPNLLGVCQYPSAYTRLEMRFAMSVLSRHRTKWGLNHFKILIKTLEYGYSTRKLGLRFSANLPAAEANVLSGYADSGFTVPRSQGCRMVLMNNAAISMTSKRHTTTDDSTTAAELTECHLCACDIVGFRELNAEIGLKQMEPTVIYQDNQSAIRIAMNRGSLAKKTRATEIRVFSIRNKVEDMKVVPIYLETSKMLADIGTKALDPKLFCAFRDVMCGYANKTIFGKH